MFTVPQSHQVEWQHSPRGTHMRKLTALTSTLLLSYCEDKTGKMARKVETVVTGCQAHLDLLAQAVEGWSTLAGDEQSAPTQQGQSWSTQEGLQGVGIVHKEEEPTTSACQKTQTIYSTRLECRATVQSMGLNTRHSVKVLYTLLSNMMHLVPCASPQSEWQF